MTSMAAEYGRDVKNLVAVTASGDDDEFPSKVGLSAGSVDVVVLCFSLMFVPDKAKCLRIIASLLKPNRGG